MGHCNFNDLQTLPDVVKGMKISGNQYSECSICTQGKMCQIRNRELDERAKMPLESVHCDLAGSIDPVARGNFNYTLCFVDDFTGIHMIYFLMEKSDTFEVTQHFLADSAPFAIVKRIRSDNGGTFTSANFRSLLRKNKIKHDTCAPYSPHQNGMVERSWRSLLEMARCLLLESKLPKSLWTYATMAAVYIRNRCFNKRLGKTPYEALVGKKPNLSNMHSFGSECYAYVQNVKKLDARSKKGICVGYDKGSPAYLVYYPESNVIERVRCVKCMEENVDVNQIDEEDVVLPTPPAPSLDTIVSDKTIKTDGTVGVTDEESRYPKRTHNRPNCYGNEEYVLGSNFEDNANYTVDYCYRAANIPTTYNDALASQEATKWQKAMMAEMTAVNENDTFELVKPPRDRQIIGGKWVFAVKTGPNGEETHKAYYVAKGFSHIADID